MLPTIVFPSPEVKIFLNGPGPLPHQTAAVGIWKRWWRVFDDGRPEDVDRLTRQMVKEREVEVRDLVAPQQGCQLGDRVIGILVDDHEAVASGLDMNCVGVCVPKPRDVEIK